MINKDQTGFISGRYIGENIRNLYDLLYFTEKNNIPGLLLLIDFEKTFDSVAWSFITKTLDFFNFGQNIKSWIHLFYKNIKSCVIVNGHISRWFTIGRGCRQGDPLSPYIFILCAEILALLIRKNKNIRGIEVGGKEYLVSQYADDTSLTLDASELSLKTTFKILKFYADASGLQVNIEKTKVIWLSSLKDSNNRICSEHNLSWEKGSFTVLGVKFTLQLKDMIKINYNDKIREIKNLLMQWSKRVLTPFGRITVIKSLAIAKINHLFLSLPNPDENIIKELDSLFFKFIWIGSVDKVKRDVVIKTYKEGGLKMIRVEPFIDALKLSWIRRLLTTDSKWADLLYHCYPKLTKFQSMGSEYIKQILRTMHNNFWHDVFKAWIRYAQNFKPNSINDFLREPIWFNNLLKVGGKCIFYQKWFQKGIYFVNDLYDENGTPYNTNYFINILGIQTNFIEVRSIIQCVNTAKNSVTIDPIAEKQPSPFQLNTIRTLLLDKKGCQRLYHILTKNSCIPTSQAKWENELLSDKPLEWKKIYPLVYGCTKSTNLRWFQFRLIHRILSTNTFLHKIGITHNSYCSFCNNQPETITHLFWHCPVIQNFWQDTVEWVKSECGHIRTLQLSLLDIITGIQSKQKADKVLNFILFQAKYFIYKAKYNNHIPNLQHFKRYLLHNYNVEKYIAYSNCSWITFNKRWMVYKNLIDHINI